MGEVGIALYLGARGMGEFEPVIVALSKIVPVHAPIPNDLDTPRIIIGAEVFERQWARPSSAPTLLLLLTAEPPPSSALTPSIRTYHREELHADPAVAARALRSSLIGDASDPGTRIRERLNELGARSGSIVARVHRALDALQHSKVAS